MLKKSNLKNHESIHDKGAIEILFQMKMERNQIEENFDADDESSDSEVSSANDWCIVT